MKKIMAYVAPISLIATLGVTFFRYGSGDLVSPCGVDSGSRLTVARTELVGLRIARNDSIPSTTIADTSTPAAMAQSDVTYPQNPFKGFDHLLADTSPAEAMAPQKSDSQIGAARKR